MGRIIKCNRTRQFRPTPYPLPPNRYALERKDWEHAICSVCLEVPHNAVLLLCSSHNKGCRPYMCGTSFRHSNCLELFKKAYAKCPDTPASGAHEHTQGLDWPSWKKSEPAELACPLCRGQVKGWTVVDPARRYLNKKKRGCMQDACSFTGTYKELKKHVKAKHRCAKPRKVDPVLEAKWRALEMQREQQDVLSTIRSSMPRSVVLGDYVIDMDSSDSDMDDFDGDDDYGDEFDDEEDGRGRRGNNHQISRRILYMLLREGVRVARVQRDNNNSTNENGTHRSGDDDGDDNDQYQETVSRVYRGGRMVSHSRRRGRSRVRWVRARSSSRG